jgi:hypothetical protein
MKSILFVFLITSSTVLFAETTVVNNITSTSTSAGGLSTSVVNGKIFTCKGSLSVVNDEATCNGKKIAPSPPKNNVKLSK